MKYGLAYSCFEAWSPATWNWDEALTKSKYIMIIYFSIYCLSKYIQNMLQETIWDIENYNKDNEKDNIIWFVFGISQVWMVLKPFLLGGWLKAP